MDDVFTPRSAAASAQAKIDEFCAEYGMDMNKRDDDGKTLLYIAAARNEVAVVQFLIDKGADVNVRVEKLDLTPLHHAAWFNKRRERD